MEWYQKAAEQKYAQAQFDLGLLYYGEAERGEVERQTESGPTTGKNDEQAFYWLNLAAKQGIRHAQTKVAECYDQGFGVPQNHIYAFQWYSQAAEQGDDGAQLALEQKYAQGDGVPQDYVLAYVWFNLAGAQGQAEAARQREVLLTRMSPLQMERGQEMSRDYFQQYLIEAKQ